MGLSSALTRFGATIFTFFCFFDLVNVVVAASADLLFLARFFLSSECATESSHSIFCAVSSRSEVVVVVVLGSASLWCGDARGGVEGF